MNVKDCVNVLIEFFFFIPLENIEKFGVKNFIFSGGGGNSSPPGT